MRMCVLVCALAIPAIAADAALVRYRYTATVSQIDRDDAGLLGNASVGTSFTGSFWYDTSVPDTLESPTQGDYHQPSYVDAVIDGRLFFHRGSQVYIRVRNGAIDSFEVAADAFRDPRVSGPARMHFGNLGIELSDPTGGLLVNDALPTAATLTPFATGEFRISGTPFGESSGSLSATGSVTSVTRAPAPVAHVRGDVNGDGRRDLLWRSSSGVNEAWHLDGGRRIGTATLPKLANADWQASALGDFTADGRSDLVWRNTRTGRVAVWQMDGARREAIINLPTVGAKWQLGDAADLNADGFNDLIWRHRVTGAQQVWFMDGTDRMANAAIPAMTDPTWHYSGASDFDGDGADDLVYRDGDTGRLGVWLMEGESRKGVAWIVGRMGKHWAVEGVGDYDGDGEIELLFVNGRASRIAQLDGYRIIGFEFLPTRPADATDGGTWGVSGIHTHMTDFMATPLDPGVVQLWSPESIVSLTTTDFALPGDLQTIVDASRLGTTHATVAVPEPATVTALLTALLLVGGPRGAGLVRHRRVAVNKPAGLPV